MCFRLFVTVTIHICTRRRVIDNLIKKVKQSSRFIRSIWVSPAQAQWLMNYCCLCSICHFKTMLGFRHHLFSWQWYGGAKIFLILHGFLISFSFVLASLVSCYCICRLFDASVSCLTLTEAAARGWQVSGLFWPAAAGSQLGWPARPARWVTIVATRYNRRQNSANLDPSFAYSKYLACCEPRNLCGIRHIWNSCNSIYFIIYSGLKLSSEKSDISEDDKKNLN